MNWEKGLRITVICSLFSYLIFAIVAWGLLYYMIDSNGMNANIVLMIGSDVKTLMPAYYFPLMIVKPFIIGSMFTYCTIDYIKRYHNGTNR